MTAYEITVLMCEYICRIKFLEIELLGQKKKKEVYFKHFDSYCKIALHRGSTSLHVLSKFLAFA